MRVVLFSLCAALALAVAVAQSAPQSNNLEQKLDAIFLNVTSPGDPGCAVLVRQHGRMVFEKGYGVRELRTGTKIDPRTNFRLASVTKQFTAMAIMLLVHDGKLHYDDRLTDIFPEFPAYGKNISIRHLLTHTAGLPDYEDLMERSEKAKGPRWTAEHQIQDAEVLSLIEQEPTGKFPPGTKWEYSNSGYVVLGMMVAKVSGMPYREFLQKRVFSPTGMNHSIVYQRGIDEVLERAFGHSKEGNKFTETDQSPTSATLGDGAIYSNVEDLANWSTALSQHSLLSESEMAPAFRPVKLADGSETRWPKSGKPVAYGFGWFLDPWQGHARTWHSGGTMGFRTVMERFTADDLTVIVLCNRLDLDPESLAEPVAAALLAPKP